MLFYLFPFLLHGFFRRLVQKSILCFLLFVVEAWPGLLACHRPRTESKKGLGRHKRLHEQIHSFLLFILVISL